MGRGVQEFRGSGFPHPKLEDSVSRGDCLDAMPGAPIK